MGETAQPQTSGDTSPISVENGISVTGSAMSSPLTPLRILILSPHPARLGGVQGFIELLKRRLSAEMMAESFIVARRPNETSAIRTLLRLAWDSIRLMTRLLRDQYDVVHLNPSLDSKSVLRDAVFLAILKVVGCRGVFVFFRGWDVKFEQRIFSNPLYLRLFRWLFGSATRIAVLSKTFKDALIGIGCDPQRIAVMSTMFDGDMLESVRKSRPADASRRSILFLSRFARDKGLYELLEAFARIADRFPEMELVMAGDGEEADQVKRRAAELGLADRVRFPGYVDGLDKARILLDARVFVLPSSHPEGLPNSILEAMGAGAVVIASRAGGTAEIVHSPDNGIILEEINPGSIADALVRVMDDRSYIAEVSARNRAVAWNNFEARVVTRRIEGIYEDIAAEKVARA